VQRQREAEAARDRADRAAVAEKAAREQEAAQRERAENAQKEAERQRDFAQKQQQIALARQMAAQADLLAEQQVNRLPTSILLSVESLKRLTAPETAEKLAMRLRLLPRCTMTLQTGAPVNALSFSADGLWLTTGSADGIATLWQMPEGKRLLQLRLGDGWSIRSLALDRNKKFLAVLASNQKARGEIISVWNIADGREVARTPIFFNHETPLAFAQDDQGLLIDTRAALQGFALSRWEIGQGKETILMRLETEAESRGTRFAVSADGASIAGIEGRTVWVQKLKTGESRRSITSENNVDLAAFSDTGDFLVTVAAGFARLWALASANQNAILSPKNSRTIYIGAAQAMMYDSHNNHLAVLNSGVVRIWSFSDGSEVQRISRSGEGVSAVAFHPDGSRFAIAGGDGTVALCPTPVNFSKSPAASIAASDTSVLFLGGVGTNRAMLRDFLDGRSVGEVPHSEKIRALAISADARKLAVSGDRAVVVWDLQKKARTLTKDRAGFLGLAFDPSGAKLAGATHRSIEIIDSQSGATVTSFAFSEKGPDPGWRLPGDETPAGNPPDGIELAFSADGTYLKIHKFSEPGVHQLWHIPTRLRVWQARERTMRVNLDGPHLLTYDEREIIARRPNGQILFRTRFFGPKDDLLFASSRRAALVAIRDGRRVELRESQGGKKVTEFTVDPEDCVVTTAITFDSAGKHLALVCHRKNNTALVRIWEIGTAALIARISHDGFVSSLIFSADDRLAVLADRDKPRGWHWRIEDLVREACLRVGRDIDEADWKRYIPEEAYRKSC
jgi:WD40 repeat protein